MKNLVLAGAFPANMHSIGDHAQTYAITKLLTEQYPDYKLTCFCRTDPKILQKMRSVVGEGDLIFISSSGDFGSLHVSNGWHSIRKRIVKEFPCNRVVQLPVSVYYEPTGEGNALFEEDKSFFCNVPNFLLLCRSPSESVFLQENFNCRVNWFPDFVYSLRVDTARVNREGALLVLRNDAESTVLSQLKMKKRFAKTKAFARRVLAHFGLHNFSVPYKSSYNRACDAVAETLRRVVGEVTLRDVQVSSGDVTDANREQTVMDALRFFSGFRVVVTDRFHAAVFAALTGTPCVALPTIIPHKIVGNTALLPNIVYCNHVADLTDAVEKALHLRFNRVDYSSYFSKFQALVNKQFQFKPAVHAENANRQVLDVIKQRRSIRTWNRKPVSPETLNAVLEAGYYAPSAANTQAIKLYAVQNESNLRFVCENTSPWFRNTSPTVAVLVLYDLARAKECRLTMKWHKRFVWQDTACASMNLILAAESLGLKSCWASFNPEQQQRISGQFGFKDCVVANAVLLGYSSQRVSLGGLHQGRPLTRRLIS